MPPAAKALRGQTRPPGFNPNAGGGISIIPRRGYEADWRGNCGTGLIATTAKLLSFAARYPGELSRVLAHVDPTTGKAQNNALAMVAAPGSVHVFAYKEGGGAGTDARDDGGTSAIDDMFTAFGQEVGGLDGLLVKGTLEMLHSGLWCFEGIPGPRGQGVAQIGLVDPDSIEFERAADGSLQVYQKRTFGEPRRVLLNQETFFWHGHQADVKNPAGRAVFSANVVEAVKAIAFDQDLSDGTHNIAIARYVYLVSKAGYYKMATTPSDQGGLGLPAMKMVDGVETFPADDWVNTQMEAISKEMASLLPDDNLTVDSTDGGGIKTLEAGSFVGMEPVIQHKDFRQIRALNELATTIGRPNAGAQTYTGAEYQLKAADSETLREGVMAPILRLCNLHLRLMGLPLVARAEYEPIRRVDQVQEENALQVKTDRIFKWVDRGYITDEDAALMLTGSGLPEGFEKRETPPEDDDADTADLPQGGTTQEETDAAREQASRNRASERRQLAAKAGWAENRRKWEREA